jgi:hypothetical protein
MRTRTKKQLYACFLKLRTATLSSYGWRSLNLVDLPSIPRPSGEITPHEQLIKSRLDNTRVPSRAEPQTQSAPKRTDLTNTAFSSDTNFVIGYAARSHMMSIACMVC